jgi:hypothetical protein
VNSGGLSSHTLGLLAAVVLPLFAVLSTWAGFGCSEGECGILATVLGLLWLPIILAWLVVVGVLLSRWLGKNKS